MDNETKYELKLDAKDFIAQLNQIQEVLRRIDGIITQQSGKKFAIDVQIKNADVQRVFENLAKIMERADGKAENIANSMERAFGKSKSIDRATKAIEGYEKATATATKRVKDTAAKTAEAISDVYKKQDASVVTFINRSEKAAKQSAQSVAAAYSKAFRETKKDLESIGIDTSKMSVKDIIKFRQDLDRMYNKRQTSQDLTKSFRENWDKTLTNLNDRLGDIAEKNADKQGRLLERTADKEVALEQEAQMRIQKMRDAAAEKEEQRRVRRELYRGNVAQASQMLQQQIAESGSSEEQKLTSQYNRAVQRIRGIYQAAVIHGRVENPETILAGLTELQQRSLALNNFRLSEQMGISKLNDQLKTTVKRFDEMGTRLNKVSSVVQNTVQAFSTIQSYASSITSTFLSLSRTALSRITNQVSSLVSSATEAYKSLEVSMIGFQNFFGEENANRLYQRIKNIAAEAPGLGTTDLADYVRQIAPVSGHNADLALNASLGMLKTIQYGGASGSSEMEYVIKNIRDVISKGKATAIDVSQFNRAMPILEEVLGSVGQSQLLKDGVLTINKDNVDTILSAFAALNTSNQSAVKDIFSQMNQTLSGQWEQFTEQTTTNLMEALRGSGVYGGAQNLLSQLNSGEYVNNALRKLQEALGNIINNINWFKVQRVATEIWDGLKIIWEGVQDAARNITSALGKTRSGNVIESFSRWIADLIRGLSDGVAQVLRFIQYLEQTGVMNKLSRVIGWFGSIGAKLTQLMGTLFSHIINIAGNAAQLVSKYMKWGINKRLGSLSEQLNAIPIRARSQLVSGTDLLTGSGVADPQVTAINNLTNIVNSHLMKIEANQTGRSSLGRVETATNNGNRYIWSSDFDDAGNGAIGTWDEKTRTYNWHGYSDNKVGYAEYQKLTTQNKLSASNSAFLQRVGNNKIVDSTIKWIKSAGQKILAFVQKLMGNIMQGGIALMITESITGIIESLDTFGDATTAIAGVVKSAGYAISGALVGRTFGGVAGGIVGALVGLGVGIADLVKKIKEKEDEITNTKIQKALDEEQKNILDSVKEGLIKSGALSANLNERSNEENYALQQLSRIIANSSTMELEALGARGLADVYGDALRYKTIQENFTNKNEGLGYDWSQHAGGVAVTKDNREYLGKIFDMVNKYDLLANHGYEQGYVEGQRVYVDSEGNALSAETIWDEFFNTQEGLETVTSQQIDDMQTYLEGQEREQMTKWDAIEKKLEEISNVPGMSWYNLIDARLREANLHLLAIQAQNPTKESVTAIYGEAAGNSFEKMKSLSSGFGNKKDSLAAGLMGNEWAREKYPDLFNSSFEKYGISQTGNTKVDDLRLLAASENLESDALNDLTAEQIERIYDLLRSQDWSNIGINVVLDRLYGDMGNTSDAAKRSALANAIDDISGFRLTDTNILWWLRLLLKNEEKIGDGYRFFAHGGLLTPAYRGIDTVPAMLAPGEFVMKPSAVKKAGLGMMYALNRGDLGAAARSLASNVSNNWYKNNNASINNSRNTKTNINNFKIINKNASARLNSYYSLANRLSF